MHKKGQFFLIAALVIVGIVIGVSSTFIITKHAKTDTSVLDLSNQIDFEGKKVVDYGVYSGNLASIPSNVGSLIGNYSKNEPGTQIEVIYGSSDGNLCSIAVSESGGCQSCLAYVNPLQQDSLNKCINGDGNTALCLACQKEYTSWNVIDPFGDPTGKRSALNTLKECINNNSPKLIITSNEGIVAQQTVQGVQTSGCSKASGGTLPSYVDVPVADTTQRIALRADAQNFYVVIVRQSASGEGTTVATSSS